jgi:hypothetical protein
MTQRTLLQLTVVAFAAVPCLIILAVAYVLLTRR